MSRHNTSDWSQLSFYKTAFSDKRGLAQEEEGMSKKTKQPRRMTAVELADEVRRAAKAQAAWRGQTLRDYLTALVVADVQRSGRTGPEKNISAS